MASNKISKTLVWILMGLLILGLGGFGVTNLSGNIRSVGSVGDAEISVNEYFRNLQNEIGALTAERGNRVSFAEAQAEGVADLVLARMVNQAALDHEARQLGLSVGDEFLRDQIVSNPQFVGLDGEFDREAYSYLLEQIGQSEREFEESTRTDTARSFLQASILAGVSTPAPYTDAMMSFFGERRDISWAMLERKDLATGLPVPDEADLEAYHTANPEAFTSPETKRITYAWLTPEMIIDTVQVDEQALRDAYDAREAEFNQPERRYVERLVYPDQAAAEAAKARIDSEELTFESAVEERGLELADIDLGDVDRPTLEEAADAVFSAQVGDIVGPLDTSLGPALFRVNAVLSKQVTTYKQALPQLRDELAGDRARRVIGGQIEGIDDLLAGGATVEDLAEETEMTLGQIDWHTGVSEAISAYEGFRAAAETLSSSDYPRIAQLEDGGIFAMRLDEIVPPALQPLDDVRAEVTAGWERYSLVEALRSQAESQREKLQNGADFEAVGLTIQGAQALTRTGFEPDTPLEFIGPAFEMEPGEARLIEGDGRIYILRLDEVRPADLEDERMAQLRVLVENEIASSLSQDLFQLLANDIRDRAGITLDQHALNAVHANFQ